MELQRERRYNKKSMKRKKVIPMQQTLPPAAADAERHRQERRAFLYLPLLALAVTVVVELFNHKSFTDGPAGFWRFMTEEPLAFLVNFLIVLLTLCPAFFLRRRAFWCALVSFLWLICGGVNGFILLNRMTPFTVADLTVFETGLDTVPNYLSTGYIILLIAALVLVAAGLVLLFWKGPRSSCPLRTRILTGIGAMAVSGALMGGGCALAFFTGNLSDQFANLAFAYEDYGFSYCFLQTWLNRGIRRPANYSQKAVADIVRSVEEKTAALSADPQTDVNVIFIQLESYIDPSMIQGLELSEDPVPNWTALKEAYSSGYLTVPVVGAGTANTEFEVLTGMSSRFFGPGEYPFQTCLKDQTVESVAYDLKENGYATHAIHNHRAAFYSRNEVYPNLGFDDFTALEYMPAVEKTPTNWAKDGVLKDQILQALDVTEDQADLVFTVSVQGHGKYPMEPELEDPAVTVEACPDEAYRWALEYYVNQIHEMDAFVGDLIQELEARDERTVLVLYGDHLPALGLEAENMESSSLYRTEYIIWDNFGLEQQDEPLAAYQLSAAVLGRLGITTGLMTAFQQTCREEPTYRADLRMLQYDALYGKGYCYEGEARYRPTEMEMGMVPIEITGMEQRAGDWFILGENFTPYCVVTQNGQLLDTEYEAPWLLRVTVNGCKSRLRAPWRRRTAPLLDAYPAAAPEEGTLLEAMQALPARDRAVLHLYYYEGYQTAEIAALTGLREGSVRSRLTRARTRLRQVLKGEYE